MKIKVKTRHVVIVAVAVVIITYLTASRQCDEVWRYRHALNDRPVTNADKIALAERFSASAVMLSIKYNVPEEMVFRILTEYRSERLFAKGSAELRATVKRYSEEYSVAPAVVAGIFYDIDLQSGGG